MTVATAQSSSDPLAAELIARFDRLPLSRWHHKVRMLMGAATFFDAFDTLVIAAVLPALIPLWHLTTTSIGLLIAAGAIGQAFGAVLFGRLAHRLGRVPAVTWSIATFSALSIACAFSWSFESLLVLRVLQGIGLGGEVPVAATYISEVSKSQGRGRFFMLYEALFMAGIVCAALVGALVVPRFGWQVFMALGALPALLILPLRRHVPESPRWLITQGRVAEAGAIISAIEAQGAIGQPTQSGTAAPAHGMAGSRAAAAGIFDGIYRRRTAVVWVLWFCIFLVAFGTTTWLPSVILTVYHQTLTVSLLFGLAMNTFGLVAVIGAALVIDRVGRRRWFAGAQLITALSMATIWLLSGSASLLLIAAIGFIGFAANATCALLLFLYTPEIYSNSNRATGVALASVWNRIASVIGPAAIGLVITAAGVSGVYLGFALVALLAAFTSAAFAVETRGQLLEDLSP